MGFDRGHRILMQTFPGGIMSGLDYYMNDAGLLVSETTIKQTKFDITGDSLVSRIRNGAIQQDDLTSLVEVAQGQPFVLHPGEFVLASTLEVITLGDQLAGRLEGKSSLGRLGLLTHSTAGFIDPGFSGHVTLELSNVANLPITLWPGMKIGQLCMFRLSSPAEHPYGAAVYGSRYQGQRGPTPSRSWQNWRTWPTTDQ